MVREHRQVGQPGADFGPILLGHHPGDLGDMTQIVHDPGGEQLPQRHRALLRVLPAQIQLGFGQMPGFQDLEVLRSEEREFLEQ